MANQTPPYPPPPGPQYPPPPQGDWRYQRRVLREQARLQRDYLRYQQQAYRAQLRRTRRPSIVGPLLLVSIGVIFLLIQTGQISVSFFWAWYGRWWPVLLIGVGVIMLLEWAWDQYFHAGEPIRRRSLGGGVFTLLLLFGLLGIFFSGMHSGTFSHTFNINPDNMDEFLGDKHESDQTLTQPFTASALTIDNPRGDISVSGTSDDNQVHVQVHKQVYTRSDSEADSRAQQLSPKLDTEGANLKLSIPSVEGSRADLTVTVPPAASITVFSNRGDVRVASVKAPVAVTANHGDVTFTAITGPANARINNGDSSFSAHSVTGPVSVEGRARDLSFSEITGTASMDGEFFGSTHLQHITSDIRFHTSRTDLRLARLDGEIEISPSADLSADQALGPLTLATRNRNITLDRVAGNVSVTNRNGSVELTAAPPLGNITVENRNGSVNLTLPEQAGFTVQAETTNGDLENDFSLSEHGSDDSNRKSFNGVVGKGGPLVRVTTSQGDIALKKASVAPLPPAPPPPPKISIRTDDGSVIIGKEGVNISSGDGSSVIVDKNGVRINTNPDGSSVYINKGTKLTTNVDGSRVYVGADGTRYTRNADGSKTYKGKDGTSIVINADGSRISKSPSGKALSDSEIDARIAQAERDADKAAADRDAQRSARNK
ncbi:DUF4097 family beta strand repeat-containing protein [Edaphobacter aggregans]|uniref:DUF4097 family beta strand repeat-containing protein n=1 Tax=Edaphobacter aggregans TaxID=570835 RepID=UPI00068A7488|nr:DUF4097 family beta strand repeat-containing protein [Edaphobacter aggregans]